MNTPASIEAGSAAGMAERAWLSDGASHGAIYTAVVDALGDRTVGARIIDVGCGRFSLQPAVRGARRYIGVDGVAYPGIPEDANLILADLDGALPLADGSGDVVVSVETIEHLENPRALMRELARIVRPGGTVVVTTPNQLSALSLLTLVVRQRFGAFQDVHYPAHRTALLPVDLQRIAAEAGLIDVRISYTGAGRMLFTSRHYPRPLAGLAPRLCSDSVIVRARRPAA